MLPSSSVPPGFDVSIKPGAGQPIDLVLVRHGQSEANIIQKLRKTDPDVHPPEGFHDRHDSRMRLSAPGRRQAEETGRWLREEFPEGFDRYYVSSLARTVETAGTLGLGGQWTIDDRWRERDWGEFGVLTGAEQKELFGLSAKIKQQSKWYWCPPGGESLATGVRLRFEDILDTLHRELDGKRVIAVTHGELMEVSRVVLERLLPDEWLIQQADPAYTFENCQVLHYSRRDPVTGEISRRLQWRRSINVHDPAASWFNGEWRELDFPSFSDDDLLRLAREHPNLLE